MLRLLGDDAAAVDARFLEDVVAETCAAVNGLDLRVNRANGPYCGLTKLNGIVVTPYTELSEIKVTGPTMGGDSEVVAVGSNGAISHPESDTVRAEAAACKPITFPANLQRENNAVA